MVIDPIAHLRARREHLRLLMGRRFPRRRRLPPQRHPTDLGLSYFSELRQRVLLPMRGLVNSQLVPELPDILASAERGDSSTTRSDARPRRVNELIQQLSADMLRLLPGEELEALAEKYANATTQRQRANFQRQLEAAIGVEVPLDDKKLKPVIHHFTATNVALIKSIPQKYFSQVESKVLEGIGEGLRAEQIAVNLQQRFQVSESSAQLIARDQVGKFYASLNEARQKAVGITHFIWRVAPDERLCPVCAPLDGNRYAWNKPPKEGLPGDVHPQCRCSADPDVDALLESLG